jgi:glycosyltransferase involved in cell wall biosynthesis
MSLSVCIITHNEASNIKRCIEAIKDIASEIVVVDSGSTDGTQDISKDLGARVIHQDFLGFGRQKQFVVNQSRGTWVLSLDADEVVSEELKQSIQIAIEQESVQVFRLNRLNNYMGSWIKHGNWYPDWQTRLWKRGAAKWNPVLVHETLETNQAVGNLDGHLLHYGIRSKEQHLQTIKKYSALAAEKLRQKGKTASFLKPYFSAFFNFIQSYFIKAGFLDGTAGFWISWRSAYAKYLKYTLLRQKS